MRRGTTTRRAMSALVGLGFVAGLGASVAGCSGDPGPTTTPPTTPTVTEEPSPTPTPTPTPDASVKPERPAAMDVADSAGAEAAAVYFLQLYPYVYATNDLTEWRALSHPECIFCASVITSVEEQVAAGNRSTGGRITVESVNTVEVSPDFFSIVAIIGQDPATEYGPDGAVVDESPGTPAQMTIVVVRQASAWLIRGVQVDPVPEQ